MFWKILFNPDESTCFASTTYGTAVCKIETGIHLPGRFFSINPLQSNRADANVTSYRNILLEFDVESPATQLELLKPIPFSTLVWSGGKSYHAIISLEEPCKNRKEYDALVRRIYSAVPLVDKANKNPSRFSRMPGVLRDNGNMQELKEVTRRRTAAEIDAWLGPAPKASADPAPSFRRLPDPWTSCFLRNGSEPGKRNSDLFRAACDLFRKGYTEEQIVAAVTDILDLSDAEILSCIRSAKKTV